MSRYRRFKHYGFEPNHMLRAVTTFLKFVVVILEAMLK